MTFLRGLPLVLAFLLGAASAVHAQLPFAHQPEKDPYRNLLDRNDRLEKVRAALAAAKQELEPARTPRVVCGTVIVPADPRVDPKIRVGPPEDGVDYKVRKVAPPVCTPPPDQR